MFTDISQHKQAQAHLDYLANHDALTRLVNRTSFHASAQEALLRAQRNNQIFALLFIGLDSFKAINDTLGHPVGASLLQGIAQR